MSIYSSSLPVPKPRIWSRLRSSNSRNLSAIGWSLGSATFLPFSISSIKRSASVRGNALMGSGNHSYGNDLREEGKGSFLSPISALFLSRNRYFAGDLPGARDKAACELKQLEADFEDGKLVVSGRVEATPRAHGIAAYDDLVRIGAD